MAKARKASKRPAAKAKPTKAKKPTGSRSATATKGSKSSTSAAASTKGSKSSTSAAASTKGSKSSSNAAASTGSKSSTNTAGSTKAPKVTGDGTATKPWKLTTPPGSSAFIAYRDEAADPPALVCKVGSTTLSYQLRCIDDLHAMLKKHGDWIPLGGADEQKAAAAGTVEAWGRAASNPVGGWYGLKKGFRGRFGVYVPPVLEALGLAEVEHGARNNRMRAK